ncbi:MAG: MFS transporter, partial [Spirochaetota bacterium]
AGFLTGHFGWRSIFYVNLPIGIIAIILVMIKIKGDWMEARGERFDGIGTLLYSLSLVVILYGFSVLPGLPGFSLIAGGLIALMLFFILEQKVTHPILNINLFKNNRVFAFANIAALINYSATFAVTFLLSLYLQYIKAMTPQAAGLVLMAQPVVMTIFSPLAGRLSDSLEPRIISSLGMGIAVIGLGLLSILNSATKREFIVLCLLILGLGFALFSSPNTNSVMGSVEKKQYGVASATLGTMRLVGQMFSMGIVMLLFSVIIGNIKITPEYFPLFLKSLKVAFLVFALLCLFGVLASLARGKNPEKR